MSMRDVPPTADAELEEHNRIGALFVTNHSAGKDSQAQTLPPVRTGDFRAAAD